MTVSLNYIAGFFDADGCVSLMRQGCDLWVVNVSFAQSSRPILEEIRASLDCGGTICEKRYTGSGERTAYELIYRATKGIAAAKALIPHLRVKRAQAEALVEYYEKYGNYLKHTKGLTAAEVNARHAERNTAAEATRAKIKELRV